MLLPAALLPTAMLSLPVVFLAQSPGNHQLSWLGSPQRMSVFPHVGSPGSWEDASHHPAPHLTKISLPGVGPCTPRHCCLWPTAAAIQHQMITSVTRTQRCSSCPLRHPNLSEGDLQTTCLKCPPFAQVFASPVGRLWSLPGLHCRHTRGPTAVFSQSSWPEGWSETAVVPLLSWSFCVDQWVLRTQVHADSWAGRDDVVGEIQSYAWISSHRHQTPERSSFSMSGGHAREGELGVFMVPAQLLCSQPSPPG